MEVVGRGELPDMKQRWFTVAWRWDQVCLVGDRCGGLHVVTLETEEHLVIRQSMPKLHGRMGVTDLEGDLRLLAGMGS